LRNQALFLTGLLLLTAGASAFTSEHQPSIEATTPTLSDDPANVQVVSPGCLPVELPVAVDECGDTMTGNLGFGIGVGVLFPAGLLTSSGPGLTFAGNQLCVANQPIIGCGTGDVTGVIAGSGLQGGGLGGDVTLSVNPAATQVRVTGACSLGNAIRTINQDGTVTCEIDDDTLAALPCAANQIPKRVGASWSCSADLDTTYSAGAGLSLAGTTLSVAAGGVTGAMINSGTTIVAANFQYNVPRAGKVFADPTHCTRGTSYGLPYADLAVVSPPGNILGPGIGLDPASAIGNYRLYCPVSLPIPAGGSVTVTGATLGYFDFTANCLVGAELRVKPTISFNGGTLLSTVYDGTGASDYAPTVTTASTKAFPSLTAFTVNEDQTLWVSAILDKNALGSQDCRYLGATINYATTVA
jgi:hypothetical protein